MFFFFFFFNDTATTEIYTLSLHDALPISEHFAVRPPHTLPVGDVGQVDAGPDHVVERRAGLDERPLDVLERLDRLQDRKSTRLNSSHLVISYAVFCLKKKNVNSVRVETAG